MKIKSVLMALLSSFILCGSTACEKSGQPEKEADEFRFAVISDSQLVPNPSNYTSVNLKNTFRAIREKEVDLVILAGDIVDYGEKSLYEYYKRLEDSAFEGTKKPDFLYIMGNHESYNAAGGSLNYKQLAELFETELEQSKNVHQIINGYHFIGISTDGTEMNCLYSDETLAWAKQCLDESVAEDPSRPVFVAVHVAPENTVSGSATQDGLGNASLDGLFKDYPQVVLFSGHSHRPLADPLSIYQKDYTVVNTQAVAYTSVATFGVGVVQPGSIDYRYPEGYNDYGYGLICSVDKKTDRIVMERMNFTLNKKLGDDFVLESFEKENFVYTDDRYTKDVAPIFSDSAQLTIEKDIVSTEKYNSYLKFQAATHSDCVICYQVVVNDGKEEKKYIVYTDYFKGKESMAKNCELYIPGFSLSKTYDISVYAVSPYHTLSAIPLTAHIEAQK